MGMATVSDRDFCWLKPYFLRNDRVRPGVSVAVERVIRGDERGSVAIFLAGELDWVGISE